MEPLISNIKESIKVATIALAITLGVTYAFASWTGPTLTPPNNNVEAPINVGTVDQIKSGGLGVNTLAVFGNGAFSGYLKVGSTTSTCNTSLEGSLQFKTSGNSCLQLCVDSGWQDVSCGDVPVTAVSCKELFDSGVTESGIYQIYPNDLTLDVYCDMVTEGGGWTLIGKMTEDSAVWSKATEPDLWRTTGVLNDSDLTLDHGNSKYESYNNVEVTYVMGISYNPDDVFVIQLPATHLNMYDLIMNGPNNYGTAIKQPQSGTYLSGYSSSGGHTDWKIRPYSYLEGWRGGMAWIGSSWEYYVDCTMADRESTGLGVYHSTATGCSGYLYGAWGVKGPDYATLWVR